MYMDKRRKTVTMNDIRQVIAEEWPTRQQLPLTFLTFDQRIVIIIEKLEKIRILAADSDLTLS